MRQDQDFNKWLSEEAKKRRAKFPFAGDKLKFKSAEGCFYPHFLNMIAFAKEHLVPDQIYTVKKCEVYSSWCAVWVEEIEEDQFFNLRMFEKIETENA